MLGLHQNAYQNAMLFFFFLCCNNKMRLCCFDFRKIVDHVDWMTSPEQVADAVKRFRYVFYDIC